ncbi:MAG TPA: hypothetical protein PLQ94_07995 [Anaerolineales bacterium]|nr:hypothetical protein [Anaerolineales bacterium]
MKNKKWFTYTLGILLTLIVLAVVGGVAFRIGAAQNSEFVHPMMNNAGPAFSHGFDMPGGNFHDQEFGGMGSHGRGFDRGGRSFFSPIFGLIRLAVLGLLLWGGYKLIQKSGWRLTRVTEPAAVTSETPSVEVEEKKEAE